MKIFLVEDEVMALRSLQFKIEELGGGWEIVGTATNGVDALKQIPEVKPDLVMTDIRMPDMDGMTLLQRLKERDASVQSVIISGYQEFDYAKQAIQLGVGDYLLKPVDPQELAACLERCAQRLEALRRKANVMSLLVGGDPISIEITPGENRFAVVYLIIANALSSMKHLQHPSAPFLASEQVEALLAPLFPAETVIRCLDSLFSNEKAIVLSGPGLEAPQLGRRLEQAAQGLRQKTGYFVTLFYRTADSPKKLENTLRACRRGAVENIILGQDVVTGKNVRGHCPDGKLAERVKLMTLLLRQNELPALGKNVERMFADWRSARRTAAEITADLEFILNSLKYNPALQLDLPFSSSFYVENLLCFSANSGNLAEDFCQLLVEFFRSEPEEERGLSAEELVAQIDAYFHANLSENISLQTLSEEMGLSKVYLCRIFKKQMDITPIDYFTRLKIDRARQLITEYPAMPLREISDALGFNDTYYFSKVFKRIMGVPPSALRPEK